MHDGKRAGCRPKSKFDHLKIPYDQLRPPADPYGLLKPIQRAASAGGSAEPPSRVQLLRRGRFRFGLRLGFDELPVPEIIQESFRAAELLDSVMMEEPTGFDRIDKVDLVRTAWFIFSEHISPETARRLTESVTGTGETSGPSFELDLVLITDFSSDIGGGLQFTLRH